MTSYRMRTLCKGPITDFLTSLRDFKFMGGFTVGEGAVVDALIAECESLLDKYGQDKTS